MIRHALVLTAGLGTRLRPLTDVRAKPAIPVAGEPMIRRIIRGLVAQGIDDLVLNLHHLPATLTAVVGDGRDLGARVRYSWEPVILGSAGGPRLARPIVGAPAFWIVNGDTLTDLSYAALAERHAATGARVTLALVPNREFARYGGVHLDGDGGVTRFTRAGAASAGSCHYIGVQLVDGAVFDAVQPGEAARSIGGVYDALMASSPGAVRGFVSDASFFDVGTIDDYRRTHDAFCGAIDGAALQRDPTPSVNRGTTIDPSARVTRSILWEDVHVGAGALLDECIVTDGVAVPPGAAYMRSVLVRGDDDRPIVAPLSVP
ncbi:MAG TPA: sugar phosphate nucleotidyltransferase [Vicinamibacterales bacterium]|nr:sugar phosphate nucleotidyltransferase [Vicinamibacterales bacterium]